MNASGDGAESDESDAKAPAALTVTVSNVAASTGTLTLVWTGHTLPKIASYKSFSSPYTGCTNLNPDASTVSWTNLKSNTNYRFTLHTNDNCSSKLITAPRFKTFPGKPTTPTVSTNVGSGSLTISSSVIGNPALDKWQYNQERGHERVGDRVDRHLGHLDIALLHTPSPASPTAPTTGSRCAA